MLQETTRMAWKVFRKTQAIIRTVRKVFRMARAITRTAWEAFRKTRAITQTVREVFRTARAITQMVWEITRTIREIKFGERKQVKKTALMKNLEALRISGAGGIFRAG